MKKRYWLRGGILFSVLGTGTILILIPFLSPLKSNLLDLTSGPSQILIVFLILLLGLASMVSGCHDEAVSGFGYHPIKSNCETPAVILLFITAFIIFFAIGAILGWLYGKIKNRNHVQQL